MAFQGSAHTIPLGAAGEEFDLGVEHVALFYSLEHDASIVDWRSECFRAAGLNRLQAYALAVRRDVDRVLVEKLASALKPSDVVAYFAT